MNLTDVLRGRWPVDWALAHLGRPNLAGNRKLYIGDAVLYLLCCKEGLVADRTPTKTVADLFSVDQSTVRRWRGIHTSVSTAEIRVAFEDFEDESLLESGIRTRLNAAAREYLHLIHTKGHRS